MSHVAGAFTGVVRDSLTDGLMAGEAPEIAETTAVDAAALVTYINTVLLPALADRGVITIAE
ncbi:hypothetical protein [Nocardiopsis sp. NRRL B-16309]|uniref:hypothetical protein n=1 Tax=Nocardiopsis sp. NRRL B-16309 TaxID=1519494 RepID=UPI0006AFAE59|nr:hypothetical protein [Nocardiopsis sp. NRRL B-16309]KOX10138.1 hypothetical protein ADL05_26025 [Nocardiopsis sp. NRRL B-16309]